MNGNTMSIWPVLNVVQRDIFSKLEYFAVLDNGDDAIVITKDSQVYAIGINGNHCPLGVGSTSSFTFAKKVSGLCDKG